MTEVIEVTPLKGSALKGSVSIPARLKSLGDGAVIPPRYHVIRVMTIKDGDKRVVWDSGDLDQINDAKDMFDQLVMQGLVPYKVGLDGKATAEVMDEFDPGAEEILFLPISAVAGG